MSDDQFEDDGVNRRRKKSPRLRKDGQPDRRCPPKEHRFKKGAPSPNPDGARRHRHRRKAAVGDALDIGEIVRSTLARLIEVKMNGEPDTVPKIVAMTEAIANRAITRGDHRSLEALVSLLPPPPKVVDLEEQRQREELSAKLMEFVNASASLKKGIVPRRDVPSEPEDED